jgi:hypothetical protein
LIDLRKSALRSSKKRLYFDQSIGKALALALFVYSWTEFAITDNAIRFFHELAPCCFALFGSLFLPIRYKNLDKKINLIGFMYTFSNLLDEFLFNPQKFQINEYVFAALTIIFVTCQKKEQL